MKMAVLETWDRSLQLLQRTAPIDRLAAVDCASHDGPRYECGPCNLQLMGACILVQPCGHTADFGLALLSGGVEKLNLICRVPPFASKGRNDSERRDPNA